MVSFLADLMSLERKLGMILNMLHQNPELPSARADWQAHLILIRRRKEGVKYQARIDALSQTFNDYCLMIDAQVAEAQAVAE